MSIFNVSSGVIGSGLAVFSKHRILDVFFYRFSVNGYPYMVGELGSVSQHIDLT